MPDKVAVFDNTAGFYRYPAVSRRDRDWGLFVTGTGHEVLNLKPAAAAAATPTPYRMIWKSAEEAAQPDIVFDDASYPRSYQYDWGKGRTLLDEFGLFYFNGGSPWRVETEAIGNAISVQPGSIVLMFPGVWHRYAPLLDDANTFSSSLWCHFGGASARRWQQRHLLSPRNPVLRVGGNPTIESIFRRMHNYAQAGESACLQQALASALMELLATADAASRLLAEPTIPLDIIHQAKSALDDLAAPQRSVRQVARMFNQPYNQFCHCFKLATGLSPHQYHSQAVIRRAKELLEGTELSVKEIAAVLRFSEQYYFARLFKQKTGSTPTDWRARFQRKNARRR